MNERKLHCTQVLEHLGRMETSIPTRRMFIEIGSLRVFVLVGIGLLLGLLFTEQSHDKNV